MEKGSCSCNHYAFRAEQGAEADVTLEKHLIATNLVYQLLYAEEWSKTVERLSRVYVSRGCERIDHENAFILTLDEVRYAASLAALLHDIGKSAPRYRNAPNYYGHEVIGAAILLSTLPWLDDAYRVPVFIAGIASLLHHHAMDPSRLSKAADTLHGDLKNTESLSCIFRCAASVIASLRRAVKQLDLDLAVSMDVLADIEDTIRMLADYLNGALDCVNPLLDLGRGADPHAALYKCLVGQKQSLLTPITQKACDGIINALASIATGFTSVSDSLAVLIDGRVNLRRLASGGPQSIADRLRRRYEVRVLLEKSGNPYRLFYYVFELGRLSELLSKL